MPAQVTPAGAAGDRRDCVLHRQNAPRLKGLKTRILDTPTAKGLDVRQSFITIPGQPLECLRPLKLALTRISTIKPYNEAAGRTADSKTAPSKFATLLDSVQPRWTAVAFVEARTFCKSPHHPEHGSAPLTGCCFGLRWHGKHHARMSRSSQENGW